MDQKMGECLGSVQEMRDILNVKCAMSLASGLLHYEGIEAKVIGRFSPPVTRHSVVCLQIIASPILANNEQLHAPDADGLLE